MIIFLNRLALIVLALALWSNQAWSKKKAPPSQVRDISRGQRGTTITLELRHGPFPCRGKAYRDATTLVFVPSYYRVRGGRLDTVLHFHGHRTTAGEAMKEHRLREQLFDSKQNAILVMPQGPVNANDSDGGKLDGPQGLSRFLAEVRQALQSREVTKALGRSAIPRGTRVGYLCISAHSGGYAVTSQCLRHGGYNVNEVYLFDALYSDEEAFLDWVVNAQGKGRHKLISYYGGGKVKRLNYRLMSLLKKAGVRFFHETREGELTRAQLTKGRAIFIRTNVSHGGLTHFFNNLRDCLYASNLKRYLDSPWFKDKNKKRTLDRMEN